MCFTSRLKFVLCIFIVLQLILTIEILVFDFLGYLWIPILANTLHLVFALIGLFGAIQKRYNCTFAYMIWLIIFFVWNIFLICFYLGIGVLDQSRYFLSLNVVQSSSWWEDHGVGCNSSTTEPSSDCGLISYVYVEIIHSACQLLLSTVLLCCSIPFYIFVKRERLKNKETCGRSDVVRMNSLMSGNSHYQQANRSSSVDAIIQGEYPPSREISVERSRGSPSNLDETATRMTSLDSLTNPVPNVSSDKSPHSHKHHGSTRKVKSASKERRSSRRRSSERSHRSSRQSSPSPPAGSQNERPRLPWVTVTKPPDDSRPALQRVDSEVYSETLPAYDSATYVSGLMKDVPPIHSRPKTSGAPVCRPIPVARPPQSSSSACNPIFLDHGTTIPAALSSTQIPSAAVPLNSSTNLTTKAPSSIIDFSVNSNLPPSSSSSSSNNRSVKHPYPTSVPLPEVRVLTPVTAASSCPDKPDETSRALTRKSFKPPVLASINRNQNLIDNLRSSNRSLSNSSDSVNMHSINRSRPLLSEPKSHRQNSLESVEKSVEQSGEVYL